MGLVDDGDQLSPPGCKKCTLYTLLPQRAQDQFNTDDLQRS